MQALSPTNSSTTLSLTRCSVIVRQNLIVSRYVNSHTCLQGMMCIYQWSRSGIQMLNGNMKHSDCAEHLHKIIIDVYKLRNINLAEHANC